MSKVNKCVLIIGCCLVLFFVGCSEKNVVSKIIEQSTTSVMKETHEHKIPVKLSKHIDGDTSRFIVDGKEEIVRYLLIDTPETVNPNVVPQKFGKEASDRTKELLETATTIEIMFDKGDKKENTDTMKVAREPRLLVYVFVDGELIEDILVREGLARIAYVKEPNTLFLDQLIESETYAKAEKVGIWSIEGYVTNEGFSE